MVKVVAVVSVRLSDLRAVSPEFALVFNAAWERCLECGQEATHVVFGITDDDACADRLRSDPLAADVISITRDLYGTNIEMPTCEAHLHGVQ